MTQSIRRIESRQQLSDAGVRHTRAWLPSKPTRSMILVHGYAEHCGRYDEMAIHFASRGFAVHAYDQAGHGRSPGPRGDVDRFDRLLDELMQFIEGVRKEHSELPLALVGHSMGGLVVAATGALRSPPVDRIVLSGALLEVPSDMPRWKEALARLVAPLGRRVAFSAGLDAEGLSRDPEVGRRYEADPFVKDRMSARFAVGMSSMIRSVRSAAAAIDRPTLVLHGEADPMCPVSGSRALHADLSAEIAEASRLRLYPELRHEIFNEPEREQVWQDMLEWLDE